ncbi:MAG: 30S ribosomal protein S6 [Myxococcota bacterium]|nr:30S ribosomal protein S6 [Myxococcota bacterium]
MTTQKLRQYEFIYLIQPEANDEARAKLQELLEGTVADFGGAIQKAESWGKRKLAYEIKKLNKAYYQYNLLSGLPGMTKELERIFRLRDDCIRFLTIKVADHFQPADEAESEESE